jgi:hypothetical protein
MHSQHLCRFFGSGCFLLGSFLTFTFSPKLGFQFGLLKSFFGKPLFLSCLLTLLFI